MEKMSSMLQKMLDRDYNVQQGRYNFNLIDTLHADENAHTRILAALLGYRPILHSFLRMIQCRCKAAKCKKVFDDEAIAETSPKMISTFSSYIDLMIESKSFSMLIENKIHNAPDQDKQIERYVDTALQNNDNVFVIYLTLDGTKEVSENSLTKKCRDNCSFITLNYKNDILEWLKNGLCFSVNEQLDQPFLQTGIIQYIHHLEELTGKCSKADPYNRLKSQIKEIIQAEKSEFSDKNPAQIAAQITGEIDYFAGYLRLFLISRPQILKQYIEKIPEKEQECLLRDYICSLFGIFHRNCDGWVNFGRIGDTAVHASLYHWSNLSPIQLELYRDGGDLDDYNKDLNCFEEKLKAFFHLSVPHQDSRLLRYPIKDTDEAYKIVSILKPSETQSQAWENADKNILEHIKNIQKFDILKRCLLELYNEKNRIDNCDQESFNRMEGNGICFHYVYDRNGIALQHAWRAQYKYQDFEMWSQNDPFPIIQELMKQDEIMPFNFYYWNAKTVLVFPIVNEDYGKKLRDALIDVRTQIHRLQ